MGNLKSKRSYELPEEVWHVAHVAKIFHIGTHDYFDDGPWEQFVAFFELAETDSSGNNFLVRKTIKISNHEKSTLTALIRATGVSCDEDGFPNARDLIGLPLYLEIVHKENNEGVVKAYIGSMARVPKGMEIPEPTIKTAYFWMDADGFNKQALDKNSGQFPDWAIDLPVASPEFAEITAPDRSNSNGASAAKDNMKAKPKAKPSTLQSWAEDEVPL